MKISILWASAAILISILAAVLLLTKKENELTKTINSQFECGFFSMNPTQLPFSFQFFLISLLFLIFDIEIAIILSYPLEPKSTQNIIMMTMFLGTLFIGLMYEWQKSKINWSK